MYHKLKKCLNSRSSHQRCSIEKAVLKNFAIFTGKHLRWSLFLIELQVWGPATVLKETPAKVFFCAYCEIFKNTYFQEKLQTTASLNCKQQRLPPALNSISLFSSRSTLRFKEFSLGCLVVDSSLIRKKEKLAEMVTRVIRCHSLSLVVNRCTSRCTVCCHSLSLDVPLVYLFIFYQLKSLSMFKLFN